MKKDPDLKSKEKEDVKETKPRAKKIEYEGSRWSSLGLLIFTVVVGFFLYLSAGR